MGQSDLSAEQMAGYFWAHQPPGSPCLTVSVEELTAYFSWHGNAENIRGDIAFAQSIVETGWFRYGGSVQCGQNNYGGFVGKSFPDGETGVRAQIQHLHRVRRPVRDELLAAAVGDAVRRPGLRLRQPQGQGPELERHGERQLGLGSRLRRQGADRLQRDARRRRSARRLTHRY